jgi:hypothetical protein
MNTMTVKVDRHSSEWYKVDSFVRSLGLNIIESDTDTHVRSGWDKAAMEMHEYGDDKLLIDSVFDDEFFEL